MESKARAKTGTRTFTASGMEYRVLVSLPTNEVQRECHQMARITARSATGKVERFYEVWGPQGKWYQLIVAGR